MSKTPNSVCAICGKPYYCCNDCKSTKSFTPWRRVTDTMEHYKIFLILKDYTNQAISKQDASEMLQRCNLAGLDTFKEDIRAAIIEIMPADFH